MQLGMVRESQGSVLGGRTELLLKSKLMNLGLLKTTSEYSGSKLLKTAMLLINLQIFLIIDSGKE